MQLASSCLVHIGETFLVCMFSPCSGARDLAGRINLESAFLSCPVDVTAEMKLVEEMWSEVYHKGGPEGYLFMYIYTSYHLVVACYRFN